MLRKTTIGIFKGDFFKKISTVKLYVPQDPIIKKGNKNIWAPKKRFVLWPYILKI